MVFKTGTAIDEQKDFDGLTIGGLRCGLVGVYDESPSQVAATEFVARVANANPDASVWWVDGISAFGGYLPFYVTEPFPSIEERSLIVSSKGVGDLYDFIRVIEHPGSVVAVLSLMAFRDVDEQSSMIGPIFTEMASKGEELDMLFLVTTYAVGGRAMGRWRPRAYGGRELNERGHTILTVTYRKGRFGIRVPISRFMPPLLEWIWDDGCCTVGQ